MSSPRQDSLFAPAEVGPPRAAPAARGMATRAQGERPPGWRPVTDPAREQACEVCAGAASCGIGRAWFCVPHAPADFWPSASSTAAGKMGVGR